MNVSKYKQSILSLFTEHHLLSINDVCTLLPQADYSTIYRNIESLESEGILTKLTFDTKRTLYELSEKHTEHHHFVCQECTQISDIPTEYIHITPFTHTTIETIVMYGKCQTCSQ